MPKPPFTMRGIDHVVLRVRDVDRMLAFYCDVLGCRREKDQVDLGLWQLRAGNALIDLVDVEGTLGRQKGAPPGAEGANMDHFCLQVAGYEEDAIIQWLRQHGADVGAAGSRYGAEGEGRSIYLVDPEGNGIELKAPVPVNHQSGV